jgi:hypothetical protein
MNVLVENNIPPVLREVSHVVYNQQAESRLSDCLVVIRRKVIAVQNEPRPGSLIRRSCPTKAAKGLLEILRMGMNVVQKEYFKPLISNELKH